MWYSENEFSSSGCDANEGWQIGVKRRGETNQPPDQDGEAGLRQVLHLCAN